MPRIADGRPVWDHTVDVSDLWHNNDFFPAVRYQRIADRIEASFVVPGSERVRVRRVRVWIRTR